ncbi:MAG TPA: LemA family protein [Azoarcus sp.]|nr:LemA family protein [Azoarcus sp.]
MTTSLIILGILVAIVIYVIAIYNGLVTLRNRVQNAFAQIDVQLQRRYDLIPNLVETAKGYMQHERETLEAVIQARNAAKTAASQVEGDPSDGGSMRALLGAEGALTGALGRFFALAEAYPDLKANQNMMLVQEELASTENRVAFSRQAFNDAVTAYNIKRETFPDSMVANTFNFREAQQWEVQEEAARSAVQVNFTN